jgi:four helix bundle protein
LNYAEFRSASSRRNCIHKLKIVAKELRDTHVNLRIVKQSDLVKNNDFLDRIISETNELVSMMVSSIKTLESLFSISDINNTI